jgi:hypothetical protein
MFTLHYGATKIWFHKNFNRWLIMVETIEIKISKEKFMRVIIFVIVLFLVAWDASASSFIISNTKVPLEQTL